MATTTVETPAASLPRLDWPFLIAALLGTAVLVTLVGLDGHPASAALIVLGFALGVAFLKAEFSFTAAWRRFLTSGEAGGLIGALLLIAVAAIVIVPVAALVPGFGGAIAPIGPSLIIGAFVFGIGMQLANGCGSGTLYTAGGGSGRMLITLALFIVGSVIGSLHLPAFLALGGIDPVLASNYFGAWGGLAVTLASIAAVALVIAAIAHARGANYKPRTSDPHRRHRHRAPLDRGVSRRPSSLERHLRLHGVGRKACRACRLRFLSRRILAMARPETGAR